MAEHKTIKVSIYDILKIINQISNCIRSTHLNSPEITETAEEEYKSFLEYHFKHPVDSFEIQENIWNFCNRDNKLSRLIIRSCFTKYYKNTHYFVEEDLNFFHYLENQIINIIHLEKNLTKNSEISKEFEEYKHNFIYNTFLKLQELCRILITNESEDIIHDLKSFTQDAQFFIHDSKNYILNIKAKEALENAEKTRTREIENFYVRKISKIFNRKKNMRCGAYIGLVILITLIGFGNFCLLSHQTIDRASIILPFIFLTYVVFRAIRMLDTSIAHYEHKLHVNLLFDTYLNDSSFTDNKKLLQEKIIDNVVSQQTDSYDEKLLPHIQDILKIMKDVKDLNQKL